MMLRPGVLMYLRSALTATCSDAVVAPGGPAGRVIAGILTAWGLVA
jgi:hypothetical protein